MHDESIYDIFISYSRKDGEAHASRLQEDLGKKGFRVWRDLCNLNKYQDFTAEIEKGIEASRLVAVVVTEDTKRSTSFVRREILYAQQEKKPIIPLHFPNADLPISLVHLTYIPFSAGDKPHQTLHYDDGLRHLVQRLGKLDTLEQYQRNPAAPDDPYREYLQDLYREFVELLDSTVFKLIDNLPAEHTPEQVGDTRRNRRRLTSAFARYGLDHPADDKPITNFASAYEEYKGRLLLLGQPGAGKTTTLLAFGRDQVAQRLDAPTAPLPIFERIAMWQSSPPQPILAWLAERLDEDNLREADLRRLQQQDRALLLLDGLDELGERGIEKDARGEEVRYDPRQRFISRIPENNRVLVTSRIADYDDIGDKIDLHNALTLQPLGDEHMERVLGEHPALLRACRADDDLWQFMKTPLLLSILAFSLTPHHSDTEADKEAKQALLQKLDEDADLSAVELRDHIFTRYVRERYKHEVRRGLPMPFSLDEAEARLGRLAMENIGDWSKWGGLISDNVLQSDDFELVFADREAEDREAHIRKFQGMTTRLHILQTRDDGAYGFVHLLLRDALAHTFSRENLRNAALYVEDQGMYRQQTPNPALALGRTGSADDAPELIALLRDEDEFVRSEAAYALGEIGDAQVVPHLLPLLHDEHADVRRETAFALGRLGDAQTVPHLLPLLHDETGYVRSAAAGALGEIGDAQAVPHLLPLLHDADASLRSETALALGRLGDAQTVPHLIDALQDEAWLVRIAAAKALGRIGDAQAVPHLLPLLHDADADVRRVAAEALGEIGDAQAVPHLLPLLQDERWLVRSEAAEALGRIGDAQAVPHLIPLLQDEEWHVRSEAASALVQIGAQAVPHLIPLLQDKEWHVRSEAASALDRIGWEPTDNDTELIFAFAKQDWEALVRAGSDAVNILFRALRDESARVSSGAASALVQIGAPAVPHLLPLLQDADATVRSEAAEALGRIGDAQVVPHLLPLLHDENEDVRSEAASALDRIGWEPTDNDTELIFAFAQQDWEALVRAGSDAVNILFRALRDESASVRRAAAEALWATGDAQAVPHLLPLLHDEDKFVRSLAAAALGRLGDAQAVPHLIDALQDADATVRSLAAYALGEIGDAQAVPRLLPLLHDETGYLRSLAAHALENIGTPEALEAVRKWREDEDE